LCASGAGEIDTAIIVTGLVPWLGFQLQSPELAGARALALAIAPLVLLQIAMLLAIEFPDAAGDAATGKRTLVVRLGAPAAARLYVVLTAIAYAQLPLAVLLGLPGRVAAAAALPGVVAVWRIVRVADHRDPAAHERLGFWAVFLLVATAVCELIAFAV
jgi:1,4-dihydroxy-2-naphthoate polyprenyltransferase